MYYFWQYYIQCTYTLDTTVQYDGQADNFTHCWYVRVKRFYCLVQLYIHRWAKLGCVVSIIRIT